MIVIAAPRCGGSIFTYNLALKHNLIFAGETKSLYLKNYLRFRPSKEFIHETNNQPRFEEDEWIDTIKNPNKYAILANFRDSSMLLPQADYLLLRRNFNNIIGSWIKFNRKNYEFYNLEFSKEAVSIDVLNIIHTIYGICVWSKKTGMPITWYEDHFQTPDYPLTDELNYYVSRISKTNLADLFVECGGYPPQYY